MSKPAAPQPPPESPGTPDRWIVLALVAIDYLTLYAHRNLISYVKEPMVNDLGLTGDQYGWLQPAWAVPYAVAQIFVGFLGDRFPRRLVLLASLSISVLSMATMGLAGGFWTLMAWRVVMGLAQSATVPAIGGTMGDSFTAKARSTAVSIYLVTTYLGTILVAKFSGRAADTAIWTVRLPCVETVEVAGWRMAMFLAAAAGAVGLLLLWAFFREPPRAESPAGGNVAPIGLAGSLSAVLGVPTFRALLGGYMTQVWAFGAILHWLPGHLVQQFGITKEDAGFTSTFWMNVGLVIGLLAGGPARGFLARRFMAGRTSVQMAGLAICVPALFYQGLGQDLDVLKFPMLAFGFGSGLYQAHLWTTTFEVVNPAYRSTAIGLLNVVAGVFGFWVNPTIGFYEKQFGNVSLPLAALSLLVSASFLILAVSSIFLLPQDYRGPLRNNGERGA